VNAVKTLLGTMLCTNAHQSPCARSAMFATASSDGVTDTPLPRLPTTPIAIPMRTPIKEVIANQSSVRPPSRAAARGPPRWRRLVTPTTIAVNTSGITVTAPG
jgi:hypothetical protein